MWHSVKISKILPIRQCSMPGEHQTYLFDHMLNLKHPSRSFSITGRHLWWHPIWFGAPIPLLGHFYLSQECLHYGLSLPNNSYEKHFLFTILIISRALSQARYSITGPIKISRPDSGPRTMVSPRAEAGLEVTTSLYTKRVSSSDISCLLIQAQYCDRMPLRNNGEPTSSFSARAYRLSTKSVIRNLNVAHLIPLSSLWCPL